MRPLRNLLKGEVFGNLTVLRKSEQTKYGHRRAYEGICSCGKEIIVTGSSLLRKDKKGTRSCGCARRLYLASRNKIIKYEGSNNGYFKHGGDKLHPVEYKAYKQARNRCFNSNCPRFEDYGGRGIKFLFTSFMEFFEELGPRPQGLSLGRINNDGNYEPGKRKVGHSTRAKNEPKEALWPSLNRLYNGYYILKTTNKFPVRL